ncbi:VanZ family protein [Deinococcus maricopensis]|uniref:VanZ family protein n=1 Tax=Deinococcus maricopensis (strain DSM 21211 / LMG 22137 / NRRL B-23946 / LB-34) TaxID=709986 RepID=E8U5G2_DEIML|nr:VanZ family protein [Deinococcus maricopensis]ADV66301.1 VanZ family protein [Deinococcus maricopensis DSM 21211]
MNAWGALAVVWAAGIAYFSQQSQPLGVSVPHPWDKVAHLTEYSVLAFLLARASGRWALACALTAWWGALDEVHQAFVPGREAGIQDWWFDLAGGVLGGWLGRRNRGGAPDAPPPPATFSDA